MSDVDRLFDEYRQRHRTSGEVDPRPFLEQVEGTDRAELAALITGYLERAPGREWDPGAYEGSPAQRLTERIAASWEEAPEEEPTGWPKLLPALRDAARLKRRELAARLAEAIGEPGRVEKVRAYYHEMESGQLPSEGVSDLVLEALARIFGESVERLRAAGSALGAGSSQQEVHTKIAFARTAAQDLRYAADAPAPAATEPEEMAEPIEPPITEPDRIDELFTGGPDAGR